MTERRIKRIGRAYVLYTEADERVEAFLTEASAERAATQTLQVKGGGTIVRVGGERIEVAPVRTTTPA